MIEQETSLPRTSKLKRLSKSRVIIAGVGLAIVGTGVGVARFASIKTDNSCPTTSPAQIAEIKTTLETPFTIPVLNDFVGYSDYAQKQAEQFGLTLVDISPYFNKLLDPTQAQTPDDVVSILDEYMRNFSMHVEMPESINIDDQPSNSLPVDKRTIEINDFRHRAQVFLTNISLLPKELIESAKVKALKLVSLPQVDNSIIGKISGGGYYIIKTGNILLDFSSFNQNIPTPIIPHELGHALMFAFCGLGAVNDPEYAALNSPADKFAYGITNDTKGLYVATPYGGTNLIEDQASELQLILSDTDPYFQSSDIRRIKILLLLARLNRETGKDIAGYLKAIQFFPGTI